MKKVLVVVDMQNDFIDGVLGTNEAVAIIEKSAKKIKNFDGEIFLTLDTHPKNYMQTREGKMLPVPHCIENTNGWQINSKILEALSNKSYTIIKKNTFGSVELPRIIEQTINTTDFSIELIGVCTDICVISNALILKANFPENEIFVDIECCAGSTPHNHNSAYEILKICQAIPTA